MSNFKFKYGVVTDIDREAVEITEQRRNFKMKKTSYWYDCAQPAKNMPVGTRVSYIEVKLKNNRFIRDVEKRYQ